MSTSTNEIHKAAIVLSSLPKQQAAQLLSRLDFRRVEAVSIEIAKLGSIAGDEQEQVIREFARSRPFGFLENVAAEDLLAFIAEEHPQTIALIASHLSPSKAAALLIGLPGEQQSAVICRIARMGHASPHAVHDVEQELEHRLAPVIAGHSEPANGIARAAEILGAIDPDQRRELLDNLAEDDPDLAGEIRHRILGFE